MRRRLFLVLIAILLMVPMFQAMGQALFRDPNIADTIRLGCPVYKDSILKDGVMQLPIGDTIAVPVYLFNDELISAFSLGFIIDTSRVRFLTFKLSSNLLALGMSGQKAIRDFWPAGGSDTVWSKQSIIIGGVDMSGTYEYSIPATTGSSASPLGTIFLKINPGSKAGWYDLDTAHQIGPGGYSNLGAVFLKDGTGPDIDSSFSISPHYKDCTVPGVSADIYLPVQEVGSPNLPTAYVLNQNSPNPFNPNTSIEFAIPRSGQVKVEIFNVLGQKVKTLVDEYLKVGYKRVEWNGTDDAGKPAASGVYLYRMTANEFSETKKMVLLK